MIERYTNPELGRIWEQEEKYRTWYEVELAALEGMERAGLVPAGIFEAVRRVGVKLDPQRIDEIEQTTKHDVIAFLTHLEEQIGEPARWIHYGMTSSDVLDTAFSLQLVRASAIIEADLHKLLEVLERRAREHKDTVMIGRSHGIHAEPITFGLVLAIWYAEMRRNLERFRRAKETVRVGMVSGAVGTFANIPPEVEAFVCEKLGLACEPASNQIIQRDRHAEYFTTLAVIAATVEKIAVNIRHLQRTEVREVEEPFAKGQKGSSAMPHKRNPIGAENLTGLARVVRANAMAALENVALWHERDISHSSVERIIAPDSTILVDYMLKRLTRILDGLVVYPEAMQANLEKMRGLAFSQKVLLDLVAKGLGRQEAYETVQRNAMRVWAEDGLTLEKALLSDEKLTARLSPDEIRESFDVRYHLKYVDTIFGRVFGKEQK
ncbi:MAG: adenylosuccinate lyase [Myxococcales bacterium]|nr:MAG: adenylosuccinate lyase [Myxococcales bacterium]